MFVSKTSSRHVFKTSSRHVFKTSSRHVFKTSSRHVFKTSSRRLQRNNFSSSKTSSRRLQDVLQDVFNMSSRRLRDVFKRSLQHVIKTFWKTKNCYPEGVLKMSSRPVFKTSSRRLEDQQMFARVKPDEVHYAPHRELVRDVLNITKNALFFFCELQLITVLLLIFNSYTSWSACFISPNCVWDFRFSILSCFY